MAHFTVLGASGFIGKHLKSHLISHGHTVLAPERDDQSIYAQPLGHVIYAIGVTADFRIRPFETMDAHVAVLTDVLRHTRLDSLTYLSSTRLYMGSVSADESAEFRVNPANPSDLYNLSKLAGEALCLVQPSATIRIARLSNVFGNQGLTLTSDEPNFLDSIIQAAVLDGRIVLRTSPDSAKDYIAIDDVCQAIMRIALNGAERIYNVAAGQNTSHAQLAKALMTLTGCTVEVTPEAQKIEFPTIDTRKLSQLFTSKGEAWSPASLLDQLPQLTSALEPEPMISNGANL